MEKWERKKLGWSLLAASVGWVGFESNTGLDMHRSREPRVHPFDIHSLPLSLHRAMSMHKFSPVCLEKQHCLPFGCYEIDRCALKGREGDRERESAYLCINYV